MPGSRSCSRRLATLSLMIAAVAPAVAQEQRLTMWGTPPREKPHRTKGAESFAPLPLPVIPQRRTEKKRPPAPPKLVANLQWTMESSAGNDDAAVWKGAPGAVDELLRSAQEQLKAWYGWEQLDLDELVRKHTAGIEHRTPILYACVYYPVRFSDSQREALRAYVLGGGTLIVNCCGQSAALDAVRAELAELLPKYTLRELPADHPVYHSYYRIDQVGYPEIGDGPDDQAGAKSGPPRLQAVTLGTRAAVIVSLEDLAGGWNRWNNAEVSRLDAADATRLGLNLITYVTAENRYAEYLTKTRAVRGPEIRPRQQLVFAQLIHDGNWNPNPSAVPLFLKELAANTSIAVQFDRETLEVKHPALFEHPLLYLTGTWDPGFTREELALLRRYLNNGGVLLVDAAAGRLEFDAAVRAMCGELFPEQPLTPLPPDHIVFTCFHTIETLSVHHEAQPIAPRIEAVMIGERPAVLYSRFGLGDGWAQQHSAYSRCYTTESALKLGTNLVVYAMQ
jgi:hypothetical protein